MPVRSINLKIIVPRQEHGRDIRRALWTTHASVNEAVRYYEERLLLMRGRSYRNERDETIAADTVQESLLTLIREAQRANGLPEPLGADGEVTELVRELYESIVPSSVGKDGNAQQANAFISPLTDPLSTGFLSIFQKLGSIPEWCNPALQGHEVDVQRASDWIKSPAGHKRLSQTGAPPKWCKLYKNNDTSWVQSFVEDALRKLEEVKGTPRVICRLMELAVLPLYQPYFSPRIDGYEEVVSRWDRLAFRLAVGHLLSWESWCLLAEQEHKQRRQRIDRFKEQHITPSMTAAVKGLERYQKKRQENELAQPGSLAMTRNYVITPRQIRGWPDLREKWLKCKPKTFENLRRISANEQTRLKGRFGDPHLFLWLARPENHEVWNSPEFDVLSIYTRLNAMRMLLERSKDTALMTLPDPVVHPRFTQWEAEGGSNLKNYLLAKDDRGDLFVHLPLLSRADNGQLTEVSLPLQLAPSGQFRAPEITKEGKKVKVIYQSVLDEQYRAEVGAADLLFDRDFLSNRLLASVEAGDIGPVYLKLSLDIEQHLPEGWSTKRPPAVNHFLSASGSSKYTKDVSPGLRVLSVDLGVRSFAACSVFSLNPSPKGRGMAFDLENLREAAMHERSFIVELPGEDVGSKGLAWQSRQTAEVRHMRRVMSRYRKLYGLVGHTPEQREILLMNVADQHVMDDLHPFEVEIITDLQSSCNSPQPVWDNLLKTSLQKFRHSFGLMVKAWRQKNKRKGQAKYMGKTSWAIQHLTDTRRILFSWGHLGHSSGDIRRADRELRGTYAANLLRHLDSVKDDRLKSGADLLVQSARGYLRDDNGKWIHTYEPCQVILFEDLSRYRMRTDRPRRENSQLMKWAHRSIINEVKMQGELYGIHICDTAAAFSSRYHAKSGTPGIRCHAVTKDDLADQFFMDLLLQDNPGYSADNLREGHLVPFHGGEIFACCNGKTGTTQINADINAAQNLQRRFWTRHGDVFRIPCRRIWVDGRDLWLPRSFGKRLHGALGEYGCLVQTGHESGSAQWQPMTAKRWKTLTSAGEATEPDEEQDDVLSELNSLEEETLELSSEYETFFRDPSGITLPAEFWYPAKQFWGMVKAKVGSRLRP